MTCKTCKHWSTHTIEEQDQLSSPSSYGNRRYCYVLCNKEKEGTSINENNDAEAAAHGVGGAAICTGPDFGCIHHSVLNQWAKELIKPLL